MCYLSSVVTLVATGLPIRRCVTWALPGLLALAAGCAVSPAIDPMGKTCTPGNAADLCPSGYDCYLDPDAGRHLCIPACSGNAAAACNMSVSANLNVLSPYACHCSADCPCGQVCGPDPYWASQGLPTVCETPCPGGTGQDCIDPFSVCDPTRATCVVALCDNFDGTCPSGTTLGDGTCLPLLDGGSGVCQQGNPSNHLGTCLLNGDRSRPATLCPPNFYCVGDGTGAGSGFCQETCNPMRGLMTTCPAPDVCALAIRGIGLCEDAG